MAPYASKVVSVDIEMRTANTPNPVSLVNSQNYLKAERYIESDTTNIRDLSSQLETWRASSTARNQYEWVASNLNYSGYLADDMGASYALQSKSGDCSEYAYLVTALSRASGLEARVMAGFVVPERSVLEPAGYHNWSEVYFGGTWHLSDAQRGSFDTNQENYIAFRVVSGTTAANTEFGSQRLFGADLPLSVRMNGRGFRR
jgi:transglutaminase-like putative cysteine protease